MSPKKKAAKDEPKAAATKRKAEEAKAAPKAKETKKEEPKKEEPKKEEPKAEEPPKKEDAKEEEEKGEKEKDAPPDKRGVLKTTVAFDPVEATLNVVPTLGGKMLMTLSDGGMQFLIGGARANTGILAGRYAFEVKAVQTLSPYYEKGTGKSRPPHPRQMIRVGFSVAGSSLLLGDGEGSISFDAEGSFNVNGSRNPGVKFMEKDTVICVVLNIDKKSPNADTVSLFKNGERISEPKPLPDNLKGKTLFPHVSFRNVSLHVNFGPTLLKELPFKCRSLQGAASADCEVNPTTAPKDGKYEMVLPVGFPNEGTFDWLDTYLEANPKYVELSDRKIQEWAKKSGLWHNKWSTSRDKPEYAFGMPGMDDLSVPRVLNAVAPVVPRDFIIMEVKANLLADERKTVLKRFNYPCFKKVAHVVMGEPSKDFRKVVHSKLLKAKQDKADAAWKAKKAEALRKKQIADRQKQIAEAQEAAKKKKEEELKAKAEAEAAAKAKAEEETKKKEEAEKKTEVKAEDAEKKDEEMKPAEGETKEEAKEEPKKEEAKEEPKEEAPKEEAPKEEEKTEEAPKEDEKMEEEPEETEPPVVELDEEEQKVMFMPAGKTPDLTDQVLSASFGSFTIPEKGEGFDLIRYEWQDAEASKDYLRKWVLERKLLTKVDNLKAGEEFKKTMADFEKTNQEWQELQKAFKAKKSTTKKDDKEDDDEKKVDDIFSIADVKDIGGGEPLFASFEAEDWALMLLRVELYYLVTGFKTDTADPDRVGIHESLLPHYYSLYYSKLINPKTWGMESLADMLGLVKDTVEIDTEKKTLSSIVKEAPENFDLFVKMTEENRRERQRRIDAGDETARLKYTAPPPATVKASPVGGKEAGKGFEAPKGKIQDKVSKGWQRNKGAGKAYGQPRGSYGGKPYGKDPMAP